MKHEWAGIDNQGHSASGWDIWRATKRQTNQSLPRARCLELLKVASTSKLVTLFGDVPTTVTTCRTMVSGHSHVETILRS